MSSGGSPSGTLIAAELASMLPTIFLDGFIIIKLSLGWLILSSIDKLKIVIKSKP